MTAPRPIPGAFKAGEPAYKKPKLPAKAALAAYYALMAPAMLPHLAGRPLNLFRCTAGHCFFQRNRNHPDSGGAFGPPVRFVPVAQKNGRTEDYLYVVDADGIAACVDADAVEFHGWGSLAVDVERPDRLALDLDPGEGVGFDAVKAAALAMRALLQRVGLDSFVLLSGGKGVHVAVPLAPEAGWPAVRDFAQAVCRLLAEAQPGRFTLALRKSERKGRIFLDWLRNQRTATAILPWSLRARPGAPVAAPVTWEELAGIESASAFAIADAPLLVERARGRALLGWGRKNQRLPSFGR